MHVIIGKSTNILCEEQAHIIQYSKLMSVFSQSDNYCMILIKKVDIIFDSNITNKQDVHGCMCKYAKCHIFQTLIRKN